MAQTNSRIASIQYFSKTKTFNIQEFTDTLNIGIAFKNDIQGVNVGNTIMDDQVMFQIHLSTCYE